MTTAAKRHIAALGVDECVDLLRTRSLGRLGYVAGGMPRILPFNFIFHQGSVVLRTGYGEVLDAVHLRHVVFEVDDADTDTSSGWSVIVQGVAEEIWRPEELDIVRRLPLHPWAPGDRDHYIRILSSTISGRRIS